MTAIEWKTYRKTTSITATYVGDQERFELLAGQLEGLVRDGEGGIGIQTLEGTLWPEPPFWLAIGVEGELYPISPDVFDRTYELYELVDDDQDHDDTEDR